MQAEQRSKPVEFDRKKKPGSTLMSAFKYGFFYILETILRFVPIPQKTGLVKIGRPDRNSPVLVTGNYHLTVLKVKRALAGQNVFLLVADSHGINVWCAAAGGHFTHHDVISAIKLSRIENLVDHRTVILPQLAASGIEAKIIQQRTGWKVKWGPVEIGDFPAYLEKREKKTAAMSVVRFPLRGRLEMATAWAFWISVVFTLVLSILKPASIGPAVIMVCLLSFFMFSAFPAYLSLLRPKGEEKLWKKRRLGRTIFLVFCLLLVLAGVLLYGLWTARLSSGFILFWGLASVFAAIVLTGDLAGSTPLLISEFREEKGFRVEVDSNKCRGDGICRAVCPLDCFILDEKSRLAVLEKPDLCIGCGACIVQCQFDALSYTADKDRRINPDFIRKHKVGLSGKRKPRKKEVEIS
jgi:NAD-dependent dihydropyrimidine dehydrogenase PreA subunit